jgi:queuine tRNA-ribosyltransferase/7-cyano-7-deazaguanine tRNA-ribosyltransferase
MAERDQSVSTFSFELLEKDGEARLGKLVTPHGTIRTPSFVAVGTLGTIRALSVDDIEELGTQAIITNAYHLYLQPGEEFIETMGGLHKFMGWKGPLMTDSGGFQIFSLGAGKEHGVGKIAPIFPQTKNSGEHLHSKRGKALVKLNEDGVQFISYLDGSSHRYTPERVISIGRKLGSDILLALDECTSPLHGYEYTRAAMDRTHRWAQRALEEFHRGPQKGGVLFGIVQGGAYQDLREQSATFISGLDLAGYAVGGSLGRSKNDMLDVLKWTLPLLPIQRPRHLLGIGEVEDIFHVVGLGIDLFDCVAPTKLARTGTFLTKRGDRFRIHILNARFRDDQNPIEPGCPCYTCMHYSKAYVRHLFFAKEPLGERLAAIHNLRFLEGLMEEIRTAIRQQRFEALQQEWLGDMECLRQE